MNVLFFNVGKEKKKKEKHRKHPGEGRREKKARGR
jgi:hypothetical protein